MDQPVIRVLKIRTEVCFGDRIECAPQTYSLFREDSGGYFVRHWKMGEDEKRRSRKYEVHGRDIDPLLKKISQLNIPASPEHVLGCDGGYTELEIGDYGGKSSFRWWSVPPPGWEQLDEIVQGILNLLPNVERGGPYYFGG